MISSTETYYGFDKDEKLTALNKAVTEMIASSIVGNEGICDYEEEIVCANLISKLIGVDTLIEAYFNNNADFFRFTLALTLHTSFHILCWQSL